MFNKSDIKRNEFQLYGAQAKKGYDWWWHNFTGYDELTGEEKAFFIEFFLINPAYGKDEPIFGQLKENKDKGLKPSYLMIKAGAWGENHAQLHKFYGWNKIEINKKAPYSIKVDNFYIGETNTYGSIKISKEEALAHPEWMCDSGEMEWNLNIHKIIPFNVGYGASTLMRHLQLFEMFWHAEGMKSEYDGYVIFNSKKYIVKKESSYGYADKNWGKDFTSPWVWLSSNNLYSKKYNRKLNNSVFDIGGGRPKIGFIALNRKLLSAFYYEGKCYEFNFSKFWTFTKTKFNSEETDTEIIWHVEQSTPRFKMVTDIRCKKSDMLLVNYEAPNGLKRHNKLFNGGNGYGVVKLYKGKELIDEIECKNVGCEYGEYDK